MAPGDGAIFSREKLEEEEKQHYRVGLSTRQKRRSEFIAANLRIAFRQDDQDRSPLAF